MGGSKPGVSLSCQDLTPKAREALLIDDVATLSLDDYDVIPEMEREAAAMGYPELR